MIQYDYDNEKVIQTDKWKVIYFGIDVLRGQHMYVISQIKFLTLKF